MEVLPFESLPLGFRFKPTDAELIDHYLRLKINGDEKGVSVIREVDVCKVEPWDLPDLSMIKSKDHEWFFFCPLDRKYPNGHRSNRATRAGYWKATGKDRRIVSRKMSLIGMKKTLVFYKGRAPKGQRTNWVIHEYRTTLAELDGTHHGQGAFVICRLFKKPEDKKQNANDDGYNCDEGEMHISSPTATNISHEDHPSDPALVQESPISDAHTVEQLAVSENFAVEGSDRITSEVLAPFQCPSNSNAYDSESQMEVEIIHEVDSQLDEALKHFYDPQHPPSPLHHVPVELGSANMVLTQIATSGCDNGEMQSQDGIYGKCSVSDFLDSVLIDPDDYHFDEIASEGTPIVDSPTREDPIFLQKNVFIESGSCSRSDVEGTYVQNGMPFVGGVSVCNLRDEYRGTVLPKQNADFADDNWFSDAALEHFLNAHSNLGEPSINILEKVDNDKKVESGIKIRTRPMRPIAPNFVQQGMANRRLRLQKRLQFTAQDHEAEPAGTEVSSLSTEDGEKSSADTGASPAPDNVLTGANREVRLVTRKKDKSKLTSILKENDQVCKTEESSSIGITKGVAQSSVTSLHMWRVIKIAVIFLAVALCAGITITLSCKLLL